MVTPSSPTSSAIAWDRDGVSVPAPEPWGCKGAFTTIRVEGIPPCPIFFNAHLKRLEKSACLLEVVPIVSKSQISERLVTFISSIQIPPPFLVRVCLLEDRLSLHIRSATPTDSELSAKILHHLRPVPEAKSTFDKALYGRLGELDLGLEDFLIVHPTDGRVLESATSNIIFARGDHLVIPEEDILSGIVLNEMLASMSDFEIERHSPRLDELSAFDEIILCGSGREVASLAAVPEMGWTRSSDKTFLKLLKIYNKLKAEHD
jgi:branched-subunit amino acid aminotransferase/4-amino-4-deoxychorismate lyase